MTDQQHAPAPTLLERVVRAGVEGHRARSLVVDGRIRVEGEVVTDPERATPFGQRWLVVGQ